MGGGSASSYAARRRYGDCCLVGAVSAHAYQEEETATGIGASFLVDLIPELTPVARPVAHTRRRRRIRPERVLLTVCAVFGVLGFSLGILAKPLRQRSVDATTAAAPASVPVAVPAAVADPAPPIVKAAPAKTRIVNAKKKATAKKAVTNARNKTAPAKRGKKAPPPKTAAKKPSAKPRG